MSQRLLFCTWLIVAACFISPRALALEKPAPVAGTRIVGYFTESSVYRRNYHVADIPAERLTHINYAFAKIENGECVLSDRYAAVEKAYDGDLPDDGAPRGSLRQLQLLKEKHPHVQTLISIGGWTQSSPFSDVALTAESRAKFAQSCVRFMRQYDFDGVDLDWEYPVGGGLASNKNRPEDKRNYTLLLAEMRKALDAQGERDGRRYLLTVAAPAAGAAYAHFELDQIPRHVDWMNLMAYDFHGVWSPLTNFHAPLHAAQDDKTEAEANGSQLNVASAVGAYLRAGVPAEKLVVGVPFYGRGWSGVPNANRGLYQTHAKNPPQGTWEAGVFDYEDLAKNYLEKYDRHWHEEAGVPWLYSAETGVMISYDDAESLRRKAEFIVERKLGGVMIWELSADDAEHTLLKALEETLRAER